MLVTVVGKRAVKYTSKKSGNEVVGTELHYLTERSNDLGMEGQRALTIFTRIDCSGVKVGKKYFLDLDLTGNGNRAVLAGIREG